MPPYNRAQTITFSGLLTDGNHQVRHTFYALAGEQAPTPTGGWAKWSVVDRPQRVGMTVIQGYDPIELTVPILFDAVAYGAVDGNSIEDDIAILEWMAGRGRLYTGSPFSPALGESPLVNLTTADLHGHPTNLVPAQYQGPTINYVVTGIDYDQNPIKDESGNRIRQAATVTLLQFVPGPFDTGNDSPSTRAKSRQGQKGKFKTVTVRPGRRTYQEIATFEAHNPSAAKEILEANKDTKGLKSIRSVHATLPDGAKVKLPLSIIKPG